MCNITVTDILNLGVIAEALTSEQISCMPLEDDDVISGFGSLSAWTTDQVVSSILCIFKFSIHVL